MAITGCRERPVHEPGEPAVRWHAADGQARLPDHVLLDRLMESHAGLSLLIARARERASDDPRVAAVSRRLARSADDEARAMKAMLADRLDDVHERLPSLRDLHVANALDSLPGDTYGPAFVGAIIGHDRYELALLAAVPPDQLHLEVQLLARRLRLAREDELRWLQDQL